ncbi:sugar-binding transcriptional regulator [Vibrio coralliilyticus]|uniref:sugar-binding transcriptional regulator n=1 Tax=Vibrio coralliilyticus TaxID=190893 RepID=UPI00148D2B43|nr:sugar-binding transcriptional regulator [Vibrio coralliilyticus]NOI27143.1 sugar-binding transcriptional regulator [Vibrio coralliilyticus]NOI46566.1 sugar-binding transcriptional regulator [Vibrio coralliilyticus]
MRDDNIKTDQMVRAVWMYYISGKNQSEIAADLGISRPAVQRLLAAAKEEGIVSVGVNHPIAMCLDYSEILKEKFQLKVCNIVPVSKDSDTVDNVSFGCFQLMSRYIKDNNKVIGIGSGKTLKKAINRIDFTAQGCKCVALISALNTDGQCNYYDDVPAILAHKIKANYYQFPAPRYAETAKEHKSWVGNKVYKSICATADAADYIFVGVGSLSEASPIVQDGFITESTADSLREQGAVGEVLGRFINADGDVVDCEINQLVTSYDIRSNPNVRIGSACGEDKRHALIAALKGKWINGLVTDEQTARWLLTN